MLDSKTMLHALRVSFEYCGHTAKNKASTSETLSRSEY